MTFYLIALFLSFAFLAFAIWNDSRQPKFVRDHLKASKIRRAKREQKRMARIYKLHNIFQN